MKPIIIFLTAICSAFSIHAQTKTGYAAIKTGLNIREKPSASAKVLEKIPYGEKVLLTYDPDTTYAIVTEGISGAWARVSYKGKTGYIVNSYLFPVPPPKSTVKTIKEYLKQLAPAVGPAVIIKKPVGGLTAEAPEFSETLKKQLYKSGAELHEVGGYEYGGQTVFLPDFTIEQGFLLLRLLGEFAPAITPADAFPTNGQTKKLQYGECRIKVERENTGETFSYIRRVRYDWEEGAYSFVELFMLDAQLVIFSGSGV
jgi:Bacterial SH3 domain